MTENIYTLEIPAEYETVSSKNHSSVAILLSSLSYALAVSLSKSEVSIFAASLMPLMFLLTKRFAVSRLSHVNIVNIIMIFTLSLTWPDSLDGLKMGIIIALRVNMIFVCFGTLLYPVGISGMTEALCALGVPEKIRVLMILTLRGIEILGERYRAAIVSVRLRAPELRGFLRLKVFASILGSVLLQSLDHSEEIARAVKCRGGFGGFNQKESERGLTLRDMLYIFCFMIYSVIIIALNYA